MLVRSGGLELKVEDDVGVVDLVAAEGVVFGCSEWVR